MQGSSATYTLSHYTLQGKSTQTYPSLPQVLFWLLDPPTPLPKSQAQLGKEAIEAARKEEIRIAVAQGKRAGRKVKSWVTKPKKGRDERVRVAGVRLLEVMREWVEEREEEQVEWEQVEQVEQVEQEQMEQVEQEQVE